MSPASQLLYLLQLLKEAVDEQDPALFQSIFHADARLEVAGESHSISRVAHSLADTSGPISSPCLVVDKLKWTVETPAAVEAICGVELVSRAGSPAPSAFGILELEARLEAGSKAGLDGSRWRLKRLRFQPSPQRVDLFFQDSKGVPHAHPHPE